jgi:hypothetical protein
MTRKRTPISKPNVSGADIDRQDDGETASDNAEPAPPTRAETEQQDQLDDQPNIPVDAEARARAREAPAAMLNWRCVSTSKSAKRCASEPPGYARRG